MADTPTDIPTTRKPRWYAPTPAKFLFAVLVIQGVLFLSAHYRWFWFNERKGYTVLITVAATAVALVVLVVVVLVSRFFKSKWQFSLATLLLLVPVMGIPCAWLARAMELAREQRDLADLADRYETDPLNVSKNLLTETLGPDFFLDVKQLDFFSDSVADAHMMKLKCFTQLRTLDLYRTQVTDDGLEHLKGLTQLQMINLTETRVTDAGLEHLKDLTQLQAINVTGTKVTDAGLEYLEGLTQLQVLWLRGTQVTDAGVDQLKIALPNCDVEY